MIISSFPQVRNMMCNTPDCKSQKFVDLGQDALDTYLDQAGITNVQRKHDLKLVACARCGRKTTLDMSTDAKALTTQSEQEQ